MNWMLGPFREGIMTILLISGPIMLITAFIGVTVGIIQAATQIQDQSIQSAIKVTGIMLSLTFMSFWMFSNLRSYAEKTLGSAFSIVMKTRERIPIPESADTVIKTFAQPLMPIDPRTSLNGQMSGDSLQVDSPIAFSNALQNISMKPLESMEIQRENRPNSLYSPGAQVPVNLNANLDNGRSKTIQEIQKSNTAVSEAAPPKAKYSAPKTQNNIAYKPSPGSNKNNNSASNGSSNGIRPVLPSSGGDSDSLRPPPNSDWF
jgi:flagellar biosynthetic protein FliQ